MSTLIFGVLLGWAIGAAGMKAAIASREKVLLKTSLQKALETYVYIVILPQKLIMSCEVPLVLQIRIKCSS
jgi:hypothetical protein